MQACVWVILIPCLTCVWPTLYCSIVVWRRLLQDNLLLKLTIRPICQGTGRESPTTFLLHLFEKILKKIIRWHTVDLLSNQICFRGVQQMTLTHTHSHEQTHSMCCLAPEKYLIYIWYVALWLAAHIARCQGELQLDLDDILAQCITSGITKCEWWYNITLVLWLCVVRHRLHVSLEDNM